MWKLLGKIFLLGCARKIARRQTAALETSAILLVLWANEKKQPMKARRSIKGYKSHKGVADEAASGSGSSGAEMDSSACPGTDRSAGSYAGSDSEESRQTLAAVIHHRPTQRLPGSQAHVIEALLPAARMLFWPAVVIKSVRLFRRMLRGATGRNRRPSVQPQALTATIELHPSAALAPIAPPKLQPQLPKLPPPLPEHETGAASGAKLAQHYAAWADLLARMLVLQGVRIVPPEQDAPRKLLPLHAPREAMPGQAMDWDVDGCELARYLCYAGILQARSAHDAARCVATAASMVRSTLTWRARYSFLSLEQLQAEAWDHIVWWQGPDAEGYWWLTLHLPRALERAGQGHSGAEHLCERAVMSQVELGVRTLLLCRGSVHSEDEGCGSLQLQQHDRMKVLVYATGCNLRQTVRVVKALRHFTSTVARHYPARLRALHVVGLPHALRMGMSAVLAVLHGETRKKIKLSNEVDLPDVVTSGLAAAEEAHLARLRALWQQPALSHALSHALPAASCSYGTNGASDGLGTSHHHEHSHHHPGTAAIGTDAAASSSNNGQVLRTASSTGHLSALSISTSAVGPARSPSTSSLHRGKEGTREAALGPPDSSGHPLSSSVISSNGYVRGLGSSTLTPRAGMGASQVSPFTGRAAHLHAHAPYCMRAVVQRRRWVRACCAVPCSSVFLGLAVAGAAALLLPAQAPAANDAGNGTGKGMQLDGSYGQSQARAVSWQGVAQDVWVMLQATRLVLKLYLKGMLGSLTSVQFAPRV